LEVVADIAEVLGQPDVVPNHKPGRATDVPINVLDITLIRRELGWSPRSVWMEALRLTADWMRAA
jgi:UDP-glucose 4-epimerase